VLWVIEATPAIGFNCTGVPAPGNRARGTVNASSGATPFQAVNSITFDWTGCTAAGFAFTVTCTTTASLWANSYLAPVSSGEVRNVNCAIVMPTHNCTIGVRSRGGSPNGRAVGSNYNNVGTVTVINDGLPRNLTAAWAPTNAGAGCGNFPTSTGSAGARISNKAGGNLVYRVTSTPIPNITNP
jgi:hypothetical protein